MSRAPVAGQTKTRLTPPLTGDEARDFHVACLMDLLDAAAAWRDARNADGRKTFLHAAITPDDSEFEFHAQGITWPPDLLVHPQGEGTLGDRMERALVDVLGTQPPGEPAWAILVGSDLPLLGASQWDESLKALERADVVFGPTIDGGYYLVAVKSAPEGLLHVPRWSSGSVMMDQIRAVHRKGFQTAMISPLIDGDNIDDLRLIRNHALSSKNPDSRGLKFIEDWFREKGR
jgi:hypothetical protein